VLLHEQSKSKRFNLSKIQEIKKNERGGPFYHSITLKILVSLEFSLSQGVELLKKGGDSHTPHSKQSTEKDRTYTRVIYQGYTILSPFLSDL